jgi:arabinogalactan oligomer/maltooligosaccharide transport system substrate-binding protein
MKPRTRIIALLVVVVAGFLAAIAGSIHAAKAAGPTLTIWTDQNRKGVIDDLTSQWEKKNPGVTFNVVVKDFGSIRDNLGTVSAANAPDLILAAHDWTGQLAANGLVDPIFLSKAVKKEFPKYTLDAFSYGTSTKNLYGVPTQIENIGLVVNTDLVKIPKTFAQLENEALAFKKKKAGNLAIAVQQGSGYDAYHMYPFFSGLGGYVFGTNKAGNLVASNIGVANKKFIKNAALIAKWNKEGLINSALDYSTALNAFLKKQAAFYVTGPWNTNALEQSGIHFKVIQVPKIAYPAVPFLGVQGMMVTKYAATHGVEALAQSFVTSYVALPPAQYYLAAASGRYPANTVAGKHVNDPVLAQFGVAGKGGVPMPNIPQMASVWADLGAAWFKSTKGSGAAQPASAFKSAARSIADKIG